MNIQEGKNYWVRLPKYQNAFEARVIKALSDGTFIVHVPWYNDAMGNFHLTAENFLGEQ